MNARSRAQADAEAEVPRVRAAQAGPGVIHPAAAAFGARIVETHISVVIFVADRVYKLRKPVRFGFLDFTSREARELDCHREVELNARFAPDVYLGVADVVFDGVVRDHLVVMRRLPDDRRLSALVHAPEAGGAIRAVARQLVEFDQFALRSPVIDAMATATAIERAWRVNFEEVEPFVGSLISAETEARLHLLVERYLGGRSALFAQRIACGLIRDGHGDLQADDIFILEDGPRILDCVEFDDRLRFGDPLADLGFLAMDLERLDAPELAEALLASYEEFVGHALPRSLACHYCAARAYIRTKVACLAAGEGSLEAVAQATRLHELTRSFLERARVRLVLVGGLPGTGKSTVAAGIGARATVLRSDEVRKELAGSAGPLSSEELYGSEMTEATYALMFERARAALELGESVVLDASFNSDRHRERARKLALETSSDLLELRCEVSMATADRRIAARRRAGGDPSDATRAVARAMARSADPWPEAQTIDTSGRRATVIERARRIVAAS